MQGKLRFLIIDDSQPVLAVYTQLLEQAGHEVIALTSCDAALVQIMQFQPDCVLCDLILPGIDGLELFKLLHADKSIKKPVFIMITAKQYDYDRRIALKLGVDDYLTKPIKHESFVDTIVAIIDRKRT